MLTDRHAADVAIAGAGIAGIAAAIEALDRGRRVVLVDRDLEENLGGLAKEAFGGLWFAGTPLQRRRGIADSAELAYADWVSFGELGPEHAWPRAWARAYVERCVPEVHDWLTGLGIRFMPMPMWVERGLYAPGNSVPRFHIVWGTGRALSDCLVNRLLDHPRRELLDLRFGHRVDALVMRAGKVAGLRGVVEPGGEPFEVASESVLIAAGGINGDVERVRRNWHADWGTPPKVILNGSHRFADGRLHDAAAAAGAAVTHLDWQWNYAAGIRHWRPRKPGHGLSLIPPRSALWLNARGERIGPMPLVSGFDTHDLVARICARARRLQLAAPQPQDRAPGTRRLRRRIQPFDTRPQAPRARARPPLRQPLAVRGAHPQQRGHRAGGDVARARRAHERAERRRRRRPRDGRVGRRRLRRGDPPWPALPQRRAAPAHRVAQALARGSHPHLRLPADRGPGRRAADGDPRARHQPQEHGRHPTDLECRVLGDNGEVIDGLFAAGEAAGFGGGGMNGKRGLEGTFLGGCLFTGRVAGRQV